MVTTGWGLSRCLCHEWKQWHFYACCVEEKTKVFVLDSRRRRDVWHEAGMSAWSYDGRHFGSFNPLRVFVERVGVLQRTFLFYSGGERTAKKVLNRKMIGRVEPETSGLVSSSQEDLLWSCQQLNKLNKNELLTFFTVLWIKQIKTK